MSCPVCRLMRVLCAKSLISIVSSAKTSIWSIDPGKNPNILFCVGFSKDLKTGCSLRYTVGRHYERGHINAGKKQTNEWCQFPPLQALISKRSDNPFSTIDLDRLRDAIVVYYDQFEEDWRRMTGTKKWDSLICVTQN